MLVNTTSLIISSHCSGLCRYGQQPRAISPRHTTTVAPGHRLLADIDVIDHFVINFDVIIAILHSLIELFKLLSRISASITYTPQFSSQFESNLNFETNSQKSYYYEVNVQSIKCICNYSFLCAPYSQLDVGYPTLLALICSPGCPTIAQFNPK